MSSRRAGLTGLFFSHKENLEDVGRGIAMLKDMALDMGNTIEDHNQAIDRITNKVRPSLSTFEDIILCFPMLLLIAGNSGHIRRHIYLCFILF